MTTLLILLSSHLVIAGGGQMSPLLPAHNEVTSRQWEIRRAAFAKLIGLKPERYAEQGVAFMRGLMRNTLLSEPGNAEERKLPLIDLLDVENRVVEREPQLSEAYTNYYGDVIAAVAALTDPRSVDVLVGAISTGNMATQALISFGNLAVAPVVKRLNSSDPAVRAAVARTLAQMLERSREIASDGASKANIRTALLQAAKDNDPFVRINAIDGLVTLGDANSMAIVERLARNDPYRANYPAMQGRYLVREAATKALNRNPK